MRINHLKYLVDPISKKLFRLKIQKKVGDHIIEGWLECATRRYKIHQGIPRILADSQYHNPSFRNHQAHTADSFSFEWNQIYTENNYERSNYLHFLSPFITANSIPGKVILDAGCGSGRFTKQAALLKAKLVIGFDLGGTVTKAYDLTHHLSNTLIVQADIYTPPFLNMFDLVHSIGVLHHLPQPQLGFKSLIGCIKPGGKILIWVYNRRKNLRALYFYEPLRNISRHLPKPLLYKLCYFPASIVHLINLSTKKWTNPPFGYYRNFPFNMKLNDAFDVLATPKSNYYYWEEIEDWFHEAGLKNIKHFEHPEAGITCIGSYDQ